MDDDSKGKMYTFRGPAELGVRVSALTSNVSEGIRAACTKGLDVLETGSAAGPLETHLRINALDAAAFVARHSGTLLALASLDAPQDADEVLAANDRVKLVEAVALVDELGARLASWRQASVDADAHADQLVARDLISTAPAMSPAAERRAARAQKAAERDSLNTEITKGDA